MAWPASTIPTTQLDSEVLGNPRLAREQILAAVQALNSIIGHVSVWARGLLDDADASAARATLGLTPGTDVQAFSQMLAALAALAANGLVAKTASGTAAVRSIASGTGITVTNGDGVSGNPTVAISDPELLAIAGLVSAADRLPYFTGAGTASLATFTAFARTVLSAADAAAARSALGATSQADVAAAIAALVGSTPATLDTLQELAAALGGDANFATTMANSLAAKQPMDGDLTAIAALSAIGILARTGTNQWAQRSISGVANEVVVGNGDAVNGDPTVGLSPTVQQLLWMGM